MLEYYITNPAGNITALVVSPVQKKDYTAVNNFIMAAESNVEQVGFADFTGGITLNMAGGEFCANATVSAAALYCCLNKNQGGAFKVNASGVDAPVKVEITPEKGIYNTCLEFPRPEIKIMPVLVGGTTAEFPVVNLGGIAHIIADESFNKSFAQNTLKDFAAKNGLAAAGIMLYNKTTAELVPVVYVKACNTLFFEKSCGSGSMAVGTYLTQCQANKTVELKQAGGIFKVSGSAAQKTIKLYGSVKIEKHCNKEY